VVRLHAPDRDQRVGIGGNRVGNDVFELAQLVAAERQSRIAVLAFGVELDLAAEMRAEALQLLDVGGSESERIAFELLQHARCLSVGRSDAPKTKTVREKGALEFCHQVAARTHAPYKSGR